MTPTDALTLSAAVGAAVVAGVFAAFSGFIMPALSRVPPEVGAAAMRAINVAAVRPPLMVALFGTAVLSVAAAGTALAAEEGERWLVVAGGGLYLVGVLGVTIVGNVPLNDELAAQEPGSPTSERIWARYTKRWTMWNHVRTLAGLAASVVLIAALLA